MKKPICTLLARSQYRTAYSMRVFLGSITTFLKPELALSDRTSVSSSASACRSASSAVISSQGRFGAGVARRLGSSRVGSALGPWHVATCDPPREVTSIANLAG